MEKLEDNIDKFLLRRIAYNIPEKAKLKRVKLKGEILDSPVLASKKYHLNEYLGFKILRNEKIQELINAEAQNIHSLLTKKRNIKTALTLFDTKTVNVTVLHNGNELTFKYPTSSLKNFYISEYNIPDLTIRDKFRKLFSDKYYNDDEIISKIVRITFRNKELYNEALNE